MAIGVFTLTKGQREFLSITLVILCLVVSISGAAMIGMSVYIYVSVAPVLYSERAEINYIFAVITICGVNNLGCYLFGLKIRQKCLQQAHKKSTRSLVFVWTCLGFYIVFYLLILAKLTTKVYKHVIRAMGHSFQIGVHKYLKMESWKLTIDRIQFGMQCCGAHSYREWHDANWLNKFHVNSASSIVEEYDYREANHITPVFRFRDNVTSNLPVVPWSCCRLTFPLQCLHDPLQQTRSLNIWRDQPTIATESLNTEGCIEKLKIPIRMALTAFVVMVAVQVLIQILLLPLLRLLYTSCRNAAILNTPDGPAPGWIFGRGDCGFNRGKTLGQLMDQYQRKSDASVAEEEKLLETN